MKWAALEAFKIKVKELDSFLTMCQTYIMIASLSNWKQAPTRSRTTFSFYKNKTAFNF